MGRRKIPTPFYVIIDDVNRNEFIPYDVMPYFISCYDNLRKANRPKTYEDFRKWVEGESMYQFWARCQWEIVLKPWVSRTSEKKTDVHWQLQMNMDLLTRLIMENLGVDYEH